MFPFVCDEENVGDRWIYSIFEHPYCPDYLVDKPVVYFEPDVLRKFVDIAARQSGDVFLLRIGMHLWVWNTDC